MYDGIRTLYRHTRERALGLTRFVAWVGLDEFCQRNGFGQAPWMYHDVVEFASATVHVIVDGELVQRSQVFRMQGGEWPFDITFARDARVLRLEVLRGPVAQGGKTQCGGWVVNRDSYDLVNFVEAGFVGEAYVGTSTAPDHDERGTHTQHGHVH